MAKSRYNAKIRDQIVSLIERDSYTVAEICQEVGISERTYYQWGSDIADFADAIKDAKDKFDELCVREAKKSLMKKVKGYSVDETKTVYVESKDQGKPKIKEQTKITKHFQPDTASIIFLLTNKAPEEFKNRQHTDLTNKGDKFETNTPFMQAIMNSSKKKEGGDE